MILLQEQLEALSVLLSILRKSNLYCMHTHLVNFFLQI